VKVREIVKLLESNGWKFVRQKGSHRWFRHPDHHKGITVSGKPNVDIPEGTLHSILKTAGLNKQPERITFSAKTDDVDVPEHTLDEIIKTARLNKGEK